MDVRYWGVIARSGFSPTKQSKILWEKEWTNSDLQIYKIRPTSCKMLGRDCCYLVGK